jgi:hypothetical protein
MTVSLYGLEFEVNDHDTVAHRPDLLYNDLMLGMDLIAIQDLHILKSRYEAEIPGSFCAQNVPAEDKFPDLGNESRKAAQGLLELIDVRRSHCRFKLHEDNVLDHAGPPDMV